MEISCCFATSLRTPDHIELAERLGYRRAWCYDSPALYPDVWMMLALAAQRTSRIGLGPGVLVPSLRHVMTNAAAIATLESMAPGRVAVAVGSGFTGRLALGQRPLAWSRVRDYVVALRALLRGDEVDWGGSVIKMLHLPGFAPARPIEVPILVGVAGPRGCAVAREVGDGVLGPADAAGFTWVARTLSGTVLEEQEAADSERALAATGHAASLALHMAHHLGRSESLPGGLEWAAQLDSLPERARHLAIHEGHLVAPNALDRSFMTKELASHLGLAGSAEAQRTRLSRLRDEGVTEVLYQPGGPDIPGELKSFAEMAGLTAAG